jgi:uracil-DNA glycosylase
MPYPNLYKGKPVASGLAFAPSNRDYVPPSLRMIYKNLMDTLYKKDPYLYYQENLDLVQWAKQGIFLINAALTVEEGKAGSHLPHWNEFTEQVIKTISETTSGVIFCFWGKDAQKFAPLVNSKFHYILKAPHPVSAVYKGGKWECNHFEQIDEILTKNNGETIKWMDI